MHASSHHEYVAFADRRFISKNELHAHLPSVKIWKIVQVPTTILMTNYVRRQRDLNEEFVSFSCELPYYHTIIQLFRQRLSDKVHATTPKGIVGGFEFTVFQRNLIE